VVYVLPVEAGTESRYGDGLKEVKKLDLHYTLGAVFVARTFSHLPWYADHPTKPEIRQESYTDTNFEGYRVGKLLEDKADKFQTGKRLILLGYGNFRADHQQAHALMDKLKVAHEYRDGPARKHDWHSGWVKEGAELLIAE
jgi:hypothetical protein